MLRIIDHRKYTGGIIEMKDMKPLQVGVVIDGMYNGSHVLRTCDTEKFEVIDLTNIGEDSCWDTPNSFKVRLLGPGEKITIELYNTQE